MNKKEEKDFELNLIEEAKNGSEKAFVMLYRKYHPIILAIIHNNYYGTNDEKQDIAQEIFVKIISKLDKYKPTGSFGSWIHVMTKNFIIDKTRRGKLETTSISHFSEQEGNSEDLQLKCKNNNPYDVVENNDLVEFVQNLLHDGTRIERKYAKYLYMRYIKQLSYEEIADAINKPLGTVKAKLHRAKQLMKKSISRKELESLI